jgi:hypothetical protein
MLKREAHIEDLRKRTRVAEPALMIGHETMATPTQRRQIAHLFVAETFVSPMVDLEPARLAIIIAKSTAEARRFQLRQPRRILAPTPTHDVIVVSHLNCHIGFFM